MPQRQTDKSWWDRVVRLSTSQSAGLWLFLISAIGFLVLSILVATRTSSIVDLDLSIQEELIEQRTPWLNETMIWITRLGSRWVIGVLLLALTAWVIRSGRCRKALMVLIIAFLANPVLEYVLKTIVDRPRPDLGRLVPGNGPSFPSGHVLAAVGFYGVLAAVLWRSSSRTSVRIAGYAAATAVILGVGFSRMFLGVHWFSDVVAAMLAGTAFVLTVAWSLRGHDFGGDLGCKVDEANLRGRSDAFDARPISTDGPVG